MATLETRIGADVTEGATVKPLLMNSGIQLGKVYAKTTDGEKWVTVRIHFQQGATKRKPNTFVASGIADVPDGVRTKEVRYNLAEGFNEEEVIKNLKEAEGTTWTYPPPGGGRRRTRRTRRKSRARKSRRSRK